MEIRANPTRMELKKIQARYTTARRGHKLLKDKRDGLMKQFLEIVREDKELRERVERALKNVYGSFNAASAVSSPRMMQEALIMPKKECNLEVSFRNAMSVTVPVFAKDFVGQSAGSGDYNYGLAFTSGELDSSLRELSSVMEDLIRLAELEKTAQLLAEEIEKTRRRVNALEYIMIPQYLATMKTIKMKLDENDRGNTTRLMKVKDMMVAQQLNQKKSDDESEYADNA